MVMKTLAVYQADSDPDLEAAGRQLVSHPIGSETGKVS